MAATRFSVSAAMVLYMLSRERESADNTECAGYGRANCSRLRVIQSICPLELLIDVYSAIHCARNIFRSSSVRVRVPYHMIFDAAHAQVYAAVWYIYTDRSSTDAAQHARRGMLVLRSPYIDALHR